MHRFGLWAFLVAGLLVFFVLPTKVALADYYGVTLGMIPAQTTVQQGQDVTITFTADVGSGLQINQASTAFIVSSQFLKLISIDDSTSSFNASIKEGVYPGTWYSNESEQPDCFMIDRSSTTPLTGSLIIAEATFQVLAPPGLMVETMYDQSCSTFRNATTSAGGQLSIDDTGGVPNTSFNLNVIAPPDPSTSAAGLSATAQLPTASTAKSTTQSSTSSAPTVTTANRSASTPNNNASNHTSQPSLIQPARALMNKHKIAISTAAIRVAGTKKTANAYLIVSTVLLVSTMATFAIRKSQRAQMFIKHRLSIIRQYIPFTKS